MKKLLTLVMFAALLLTSCTQKEKFSDEIGDKAKVTFTVAADQPATRAAEVVKGTATRLWVGVYLKTDETYTFIQTLEQTKEEVTFPTTVSIDLARNETYKLVFWADEGTNAFSLDKATGIISETATTKDGNLTNRDAYYKMIEITPAGSMSGEVLLTRPMAQINVGTSDLAAFKAASMFTGKVQTKVVVEGVATAMNLLTGEANGEPGTMTFSFADERGKEITADATDYGYLVANYVLAPAATTAKATVTLSKGGETDINSFVVTNLPVKTNYRTNIVGKLLTGTATYTVNVDQNFEGDLDKKVGPVFNSIADLNAYFETFADNSDNGNINPEEVTLKAINGDEPKTIVLPAVKENIKILMPIVNKDLELEMAYAEGATADQKPANVYFYVSNIKKLSADITSTHFELLEGSIVNTEAVMSTSGDTFVIRKGARVGTVTIVKGNAEIGGEVETLEVADGATADGEAPVEVFLEKESAVTHIDLNAPANVVVEQPADNIDKAATENKVSVDVNVDGCSATAQNGGQIYVNVKGGVSCDVAADGTSGEGAESVPSTVTIATAGEGSAIYTETSEGGVIEKTDAVHGDVTAYVAKIGEEKFKTIEAAVAAVKDAETIVVLTDITQDDGVLYDKEGVSAKLNLNNKTITINKGSNVNSRAIRIDNGTLEVYGGSIVAVGAGTTSSDGTGCYGAFRVEANGVLNAHDLNLSNARPWGLNVKVVGGTATLTKVNITSSYGGGIEVTEADLGTDSKKGSATLTNCNFTQTGYFDHCSSTLSVSGGSSLTINSGSYTSDNYALYVFSSGGEITVNGGTFSGNKDGVAIIAAIDLSSFPSYTGGLKLKGGQYTGGYAITSPAYMQVTGGTFTVDPSAYVAAGYEANLSEGVWTVGPAVWSGAVASDEQFAASVDETAKTVTVSSTAVLAKLAANVQAGNDYAGYKITLTKDMDLNNQEWTPIGEKGKNFAGEFDGGGHSISNLKITRDKADVDLNWRIGFIGSAIGAKVHDLTIHNANVTARGEVAAAVGYNAYSVEGKPSEIYNVNVTGHVVIIAYHRGAAAICGYSNYYIHDCTVNVDSTSIIDGFWASGGIVGFSPQSGDIKNNYSNIKVVSDYACGGIVGLIEDSVEISGNTVENTTLQASTDYGIGGLIGMMNYGTGLKIKNNTVSNVTIDATENVAGVIGAVWADYGTGAVEITNNTITDITINSSKGDGTAAFIGYIESDRTATISGNSIQGTINTAKALVNDGIWAGATDASKVVASNNTMNLEINVAE